MKTFRRIAFVFFFVPLLLAAGCEQGAITGRSVNASVYTGFAPAKVEIMPLSELIRPTEDQEGTRINAYVSLVDSFGCQIRAPGVFRFELYQRILRSAEAKGRRVMLWPDIDLINTSKNNGYWRDFLRAYEFNLDFDSANSNGYILQVTFHCPTGRRLSAEYILK